MRAQGSVKADGESFPASAQINEPRTFSSRASYSGFPYNASLTGSRQTRAARRRIALPRCSHLCLGLRCSDTTVLLRRTLAVLWAGTVGAHGGASAPGGPVRDPMQRRGAPARHDPRRGAPVRVAPVCRARHALSPQARALPWLCL